MPIHRRTWLQLAPFAFVQSAPAQQISPTYPAHPPELAKEMVGVSHRDVARVKELVKAQPSLANASWDWGFGDWETALGAASHVGNRPIAEVLLENGAAPTIFSASMLGQLDVVKALIESNPGVQRAGGPHSISLLDHARAGGAPSKSVFDYLEKLGDAGPRPQQTLTEETKTAIAGTYAFGAGANDRFEISTAKPQVELKRAGTGESRRLFYLGDLTFHPAGARAVRIQFDGKGVLTIHDGSLVLTARRAG